MPPSEVDSIQPIGQSIVEAVRFPDDNGMEGDPLLAWFDFETAKVIRGLERSITRKLVGHRTLSIDGLHLENLSGIAATNYVALFALCRSLIGRFLSSNPTWIRVPKGDAPRVQVTADIVTERFSANLRGMAEALAERARLPLLEEQASVLRVRDTARTRIEEGSVDFILTSPPYCTRIDYASATKIELALLAPLTSCDPRTLGRTMLGSVKVPHEKIALSHLWGQRCLAFLSAVKAHPSKASDGYYYKTHTDYFSKLHASLANATSTLADGGRAVIVVQDSYYKEIHNDVAAIVTEMAHNVGLVLDRRQDFAIKRSMADINPAVRAYRKPTGSVESVLCFSKTL